MGIAAATVKRLFRAVGLEISRYYPISSLDKRRLMLMTNGSTIDTILDVGANEGQFATHLRKMGYNGQIISFEPQASAYAILSQKAQSDPLWRTVRCALGVSDGQAELNISPFSQGSSLLPALPDLKRVSPHISYEGKEEITIRRLDSILRELGVAAGPIFVKIDTEGYDTKVIEGASGCIDRISGFMLETTLIRLWQGQLVLAEQIKFMEEKGYQLVWIEHAYSDKQTGYMVVGDCIFRKTGSHERES